MGVFGALVLILTGLVGARAKFEGKTPQLAKLYEQEENLGFLAIGVGLLSVVLVFGRGLGLLGLAFDPLLWFLFVCWLAAPPLMLATGLALSGLLLAERFDDERKGAVVARIAGVFEERRLVLGQASLGLGAWLLLATLIW